MDEHKEYKEPHNEIKNDIPLNLFIRLEESLIDSNGNIFPNVDKVLESFVTRGHELYLISTDQKMFDIFNKSSLPIFFVFTECNKDYISVVREIIYKYNLDKEYCHYFGKTAIYPKEVCQLQQVMKNINIPATGVNLENGLVDHCLDLALTILSIRKERRERENKERD